MATTRWERRDLRVITVICETEDGYTITVIDRETGERRLGPKTADINPARLIDYGFKRVA